MIRLASTAVGFKEWSLVCDALGAGRQSVVIRKGGIAEGRGGFQWQAQEFWLFPTHFHEQARQVNWSPTPRELQPSHAIDEIAIRLRARIEFTTQVTVWKQAEALAPMHVWKEEVIRERFGYGPIAGVSLAFVRVFRLPEPWILKPHSSFGGCRSWLDLPDRRIATLEPVLSDSDHAARRAQLDEILQI
jgi:hypothetical protein